MDKDLQQALEELHAACSVVSKFVPSAGVSWFRADSGMILFANVGNVAAMNQIPAVAVVKDCGEKQELRYCVTKTFAGIEFYYYCTGDELRELVKPQSEEVAADASA